MEKCVIYVRRQQHLTSDIAPWSFKDQDHWPWLSHTCLPVVAKFEIYWDSRGPESECVLFYSCVSGVSRPLPVKQGHHHCLPSGDFPMRMALFSSPGTLYRTIIRSSYRKTSLSVQRWTVHAPSNVHFRLNSLRFGLLKWDKSRFHESLTFDLSQLGQILT